MSIPNGAKTAGQDAAYAPLGGQFNRNYMPFEPNGEKPVPNRWFYGGDVGSIPIRPTIEKRGTVDPKQPVARPKAVDMNKFFKGGGSIV